MATGDFIRAAHRAGGRVFVWTVNDAFTMSLVMSRGADGVITDHPGLARTVLEERSRLGTAERLLLETALWSASTPGVPALERELARRPESAISSTGEEVEVAEKVGRNDRCPCGSGKKYKHCCEGKGAKMSLLSWAAIAAIAAAAAVLVFFLYNLSQADATRVPTCPPGQVWSPEHGHCHRPGAG